MSNTTENSTKSICDIFSGVYRRKNPTGSVRMVNVSDFEDSGNFDVRNTARVLPWTKLDDHRLHAGDLLLLARGPRNPVFLFPGADVPCIPASVFLVLRPRKLAVTPAYLHWYLNTKTAQRALAAMSRGSNIPVLAKKRVAELQLPLPDLPRQRIIAQLALLERSAQRLQLAIAHQKNRLTEARLLAAANTPTP